MKVASILSVAVIDPGHGVIGALLDNNRALWAYPSLAIFGICPDCRKNDVLDAALDFGAPGASAHRIHVYCFVLRAFTLGAARVVAARHLVPVVFVGVRKRSTR